MSGESMAVHLQSQCTGDRDGIPELAGWICWVGELWAQQGNSISMYKVESDWGSHLMSTSGLDTCIHMNTHTCEHSYTCMHTIHTYLHRPKESMIFKSQWSETFRDKEKQERKPEQWLTFDLAMQNNGKAKPKTERSSIIYSPKHHHLSIHPLHLSIHSCTHPPSIHAYMHPSIHPSKYLSIIYLTSITFTIHPSHLPSIHHLPTIYLSITLDKIQHETTPKCKFQN